jgi:hypothetical protein
MTGPQDVEANEDFGDLPAPPSTTSRATGRLWRSAWLSHTPTSALILPAPAALPVRRERGKARATTPASSPPVAPQPPSRRRRVSEVAIVLAIAAALITAVVFLPMFVG